MDCTNYDRMRIEADGGGAGPTVRAALACTALTILITLGTILLLDRAGMRLPAPDDTSTSSGQA